MPMKKRLSKKTARQAGHRPTGFRNAVQKHHGSVQKLGKKGFVRVKGEPGKKQVIELWDKQGVKRRKTVRFGKEKTMLSDGREVSFRKGHKKTRYDQKGRAVARGKVKRKVRQPRIAVETSQFSPTGFEIMTGRARKTVRRKTTRRTDKGKKTVKRVERKNL